MPIYNIIYGNKGVLFIGFFNEYLKYFTEFDAGN